MKRLPVVVENQKKTYDIVIGRDILKDLASFISSHFSNHRVVVVTDETVESLYWKKLKKVLDDPYIMVLPPGEQSKCRQAKDSIEDKMLSEHFGRDTLLIAFGGGVIGDIAGFIAATYLRGIPYIQVPTTYLAMVDSSVGGKTSINNDYGKNLIGAFHQPVAVFSDLSFLDNLPEEELRNGLAESIKMAITSNKKLFTYIQKHTTQLLEKDDTTISHVIFESVSIKKEIVEQDEREGGIRQILNFGHTVGHALERFFAYQKKHGECVSLGMVAEARLAVLSGDLSEKDEGAIVTLLKNLGLSTLLEGEVKTEKVIEAMQHDKKSKNKLPYFVIPTSLGQVRQEENTYSFTLPQDQITQALFALVP